MAAALYTRFLPPPGWSPDVRGRHPWVVVRGGGDLGSGVVARLVRAGLPVVVLELPQPLAVRRAVAFAEVVYRGEHQIEELRGRLVRNVHDIPRTWKADAVPVLVDPEGQTLVHLRPAVLVDARMRKAPPEQDLRPLAALSLGLGPGFVAGVHVHAVVETNRGHLLGRVYWQGAALPDTGIPERVLHYREERVLRAPESGYLETLVDIGDVVEAGTPLARVGQSVVRAPFRGAVRGLAHPGLWVEKGTKIGDIDPRADPSYCFLISEKALNIGAGVLEAILRFPILRRLFYGAA